MKHIYCCSECGNEVETPEGEIAFCPEHPEAVIDSIRVETVFEITIDGSTDTVGDNNWFATEIEARNAIPELKALGGDWAEGEYGVRETEISGEQWNRYFGQ